MIYGYARVSTDGQTLDEEAALRAAGAERVFAKKIKGTVTDRKALARALGGAERALPICRVDWRGTIVASRRVERGLTSATASGPGGGVPDSPVAMSANLLPGSIWAGWLLVLCS
jgi:hypothetical protein